MKAPRSASGVSRSFVRLGVPSHALAIAMVAFVALLRYLLDPFLGDYYPYALFVLPPFLIATMYDWRPGVFALLLGMAVASFLFVQPRGSVRVEEPKHQVGLALLLAVGASGISLAERSRRSHLTLRKEQERLLDEASKKADQALARMRAVFTSAADGLVLSDGQGNLLEWNPAAMRLHGYGPQDDINRPLGDFAASFLLSRPGGPPLPHENWPLARVLRGEELYESELYVRRTDIGRDWFISYSGVPIRGTSGAIEYAVLTLRDVTARHRAEDALRASEAQLRVFVEHVPAPIAMLDCDMRYLVVSRRWLSDYQLGTRDITGLSHYEVFPEVPERWKQIHQRCLGGAIERSEEDRFERADGTNQYLRWEVRPWYLPNGDTGGIIIFSEEITARRMAEQSLRDRERLLGIVTSSAGVGLVVVSQRYRYLFANEAYANIFGLDPDGIIGRRVPDLLPGGWAQIQPRLDRALEGDKVAYELSLPATNSTGSRWFRVMYEPRQGDAGAPTVVVVVVDVTELKRTERAIRESEERFRQMAENISEVFWLSDPINARILYISPAYEVVWGRSRESLYADYGSWLDAIHLEDRNRVQAASRTRESSGEYDVEYRVVRPDGTVRWVHDRGFPVRDPAGTVYRIAGVAEDVTDRRRAEDELRLRDRAIQAASEGIVIADARQPDNPILYVSPGFERMTGFGADEVVGRNCRFLQGKESEPDAVARIRTAIKEGKPCEVEILNYRKNGTPFWNKLSLSPVRDEAGQITHFIGVQSDVTKRRKLEDQYRQAQKMEAVGRLAGGVAHDFNNLLTVINGFSEILLSRLPIDSPMCEWMRAIEDAGGRAAGLTRQLLAFSRQTVLEPKVMEINQIVKESESLLRRVIGEDILLTVSLGSRKCRVKVDPGQFGQVVMNLAVNARDAMPTGGQLILETGDVTLKVGEIGSGSEVPPGRYAWLSVRDTGHGMPEEVRSRIFEPFFTTKGVGAGTGLGLAMVHGIVEQSQGHVVVHSEVGFGTTFTIYLPAVNEPVPQTQGAVGEGIPHGDEVILLVEDEESVLRLATLGLGSFGYTVLTALDGEDALAVLTAHKGQIDLLVTDVVMPRMGGRQLAETLSKRDPGLKILYVSGYTDDAVVRHGVRDDKVNFLQKPYTPSALLRKVRSVLDNRE